MAHSESFPTRLANYRKNNGLTQRQIAKKWAVSPETISAWERGRRKPDVILVPKLASELEMDKDDLLEYISANSMKLREGNNRETYTNELGLKGSLIRFKNQEVCQPSIRREALHTTKIRVLTIRGDKFFVGTNSLFHDAVEEKKTPIEVLVLSPESDHI